MKSVHEKIRELMPEYLHNSLCAESRAEIVSHMEECEDCQAELQLLLKLDGCVVPDPGEAFWGSLPAKVVAASKAETAGRFPLRLLSRIFFFPVPAAALAVLAVLLFYSFLKGKDTPVPEVSSVDPLAYSLLDYGDLDEEDLFLTPVGRSVAEEYLGSFSYGGQSYLREVVSLDPAELASLYELLESEEKGGRI